METTEEQFDAAIVMNDGNNSWYDGSYIQRNSAEIVWLFGATNNIHARELVLKLRG